MQNAPKPAMAGTAAAGSARRGNEVGDPAMHLDGVPAAVIAAWTGRTDSSLTVRLCAHPWGDALKAAGDTFNRVVGSW